MPKNYVMGVSVRGLFSGGKSLEVTLLKLPRTPNEKFRARLVFPEELQKLPKESYNFRIFIPRFKKR